MKRTALLFSILISICIPHTSRACHGLALMSPSLTTGSGNIIINASSDPASCGCGPYYLEVEASYSGSFTGAPPVYTSNAWGTYPWYHSLLNVPNYNAANGWPDNCVLEPYTTITIPMSSFCSGSTVYFRMREYVAGSGSSGPWTVASSFTIPGSPITLAGSASVNNNVLCPGDTAILSVTSNGCSGVYNISWTPTSGLGDPSAASTTAYPSTTTTYTVSFTDVGLGQTFTSSVTIYASPSFPSANFTSGIATCNQADAWVNTSVSGGTSPYTFSWSNSATSQNLSSVSSGTYSLTITDALGCFSDTAYTVTDSCDYVWPGDANDDAVADMNDILAIGVANGATGTTRPNATINWIGQPSDPWGQTLMSGTDYKWVDCNGDGTIDPNDTTAVLLNYSYTHTNRVGYYPSQSWPLARMTFVPDTLAPSSAGTMQIEIGTSAVPANNIYGVALRLAYNEVYIDPNSITLSVSSNWMGDPATNLIAVKKTMVTWGITEFALTRIDHQNISGYGLVATVHFNTTNALTGTGQTAHTPSVLAFINCIDASENFIPLANMGDTLTIIDGLTTGIETPAVASYSIYPNPSDGNFTIRFGNSEERVISIVDVLGRTVLESKCSSDLFTADLSSVAGGTYLIRVVDRDGMHTAGKLVRTSR